MQLTLLPAVSLWRVIVATAAIVFGLGVAGVAAQAPTQDNAGAITVVEVRLKDGSVLYGVVERETPGQVVIRTISGVLVDVDRAQVASMVPARGAVIDGEFRPYDANATRLMFSPTGRSLRKGQGYVGVYEFVLPFVQVGITDRLSFGVGTPLLFVGDDTSRPVWVTPKYQFYRGSRVTAAAGVMHFHVFGEDARVGLAYGVATIGSDDNAWTVGSGWAYSRYYENQYGPGCWTVPYQPCEPTRVAQTEGSPVVMVGGERRLSRRVKFLSENYVFQGGGIASFGVRFLGERLSADLGAAIPLGLDEVIVVPVVNFVWTFGE
ncbi:MAG: hypothetical protein IT183_08305 [Acidobacteria bacterium]|nr:hypothetical protein [Acidobacteriota bacterium]